MMVVGVSTELTGTSPLSERIWDIGKEKFMWGQHLWLQNSAKSCHF